MPVPLATKPKEKKVFASIRSNRFIRFLPLFLLAALLFTACPQIQQGPGFRDTPLPPSSVLDIRVRPGNNRLTVSWNAVPGAASYEVRWGRADAESGEALHTKATTSTAVILEARNGETYQISVRAVSGAGSSDFGSPRSESPGVHAPAPSVIRGDGVLHVGWVAEAGVEYRVSLNGGAWGGAITGSGVAGTSIPHGSGAYSVRLQASSGGVTRESAATSGTTPQGNRRPDLPAGHLVSFVYVSGGTVIGSVDYAMSMRVPTGFGYHAEGTTRFMQGVFVEGRTVPIESFFMATHEVTRQLWFTVQHWAENESPHRYYFQNRINNAPGDDAQRPATGISWRDAVVWSNAYSEMLGLTPVYTAASGAVLRDSRNANGAAVDSAVMNRGSNGFRLPTEVEREFAARGGNPGDPGWMYYFAGSNTADSVAWYSVNSSRQLQAVGTRGANRLGIFDLSGNAQEWGWGWMRFDAHTSRSTPPDGEPRSSRSNQKPMAGGGVGSNITMSVVADRWGFGTSFTSSAVGFRLVSGAR